jgi:ubiquinone/menaquinone biosynthesis C-methylase UbiE
VSYQEQFYPESRFGGFSDIDGTIAFYSRLNALLRPDMTVLDIGCGRGARVDDPVEYRKAIQNLSGKVTRVIGIDPDPAGAVNPFIDEFRLIDEHSWPVDDASIDAAVSDFVLEHVEDPALFFSECRRVLKPGGYLCLRTTNSFGYVALLARLISTAKHVDLLQKVQERRQPVDVFPTHYRCNTIGRIRKMLDRFGFDNVVYGYEAEPSYAQFSRLAYFLAVLHQRYAPGVLKLSIFAFARKD